MVEIAYILLKEILSFDMNLNELSTVKILDLLPHQFYSLTPVNRTMLVSDIKEYRQLII
jgi:hypothetical protein